MKNITTENLATWIGDVINNSAKNDEDVSIIWFGPTVTEKYCIVAGWQKMFNEEQSARLADILCISKSRPGYIMCVKVAETPEAGSSTDFESMVMPNSLDEEIDNTCMPLEWEDMPECVAEFFLMEWERIMKEHGEEI